MGNTSDRWQKSSLINQSEAIVLNQSPVTDCIERYDHISSCLGEIVKSKITLENGKILQLDVSAPYQALSSLPES